MKKLFVKHVINNPEAFIIFYSPGTERPFRPIRREGSVLTASEYYNRTVSKLPDYENIEDYLEIPIQP